MSLISTRLSLIHLVTVQRAGVTPDAWGNPAGSPVWADYLVGVPCRMWMTAGREVLDATTSVVVDEIRMIVPLGTDVTEQDRLSDVTWRGSVILAGPTGIRAVLHNADHLELVLQRLA